MNSTVTTIEQNKNKNLSLSAKIFDMFVLLRRLVYIVLGAVSFVIPKRLNPVVILNYHSIGSDDWVHGVCPEEFEQQMKYMARQYEPVSLIDVENYIAGRAAITKPSFALTFDDGYESVLEVAPLLKELGINPTVFVLGADACANRDELGNSHEFLSRAQIRTLYSAGWKIGSHSSTHADFWDLDPAEIRHEIEQSKKDLERDLKVPVEYFAYPRGRYNETAINSLQRAGYRLGFSMDDGFINQKTNVYTIPRVAINRTHTFAEFKASFAPLTILFRAVIKKIIGKNI